MKKKIVAFIISVAAMVSCAFGFSACEGGNPPESSNSDSSTPVDSNSSDGSSADSSSSSSSNDSSSSSSGADSGSGDSCSSGSGSDNDGSSDGGSFDTLTPEMEDELSGFYYTFAKNSCVITGIKDKTVTEIVIPDGVTAIGDSAFEECTSLESVVIGGGVTSIGERAFYGCESLFTIEIPDSVTSIGAFAFEECYVLTDIIFKDTSTWYKTYNVSDWENQTGGEEVDLTDSSRNAMIFVDVCCHYNFYKL